jgi:hypothetical protein
MHPLTAHAHAGQVAQQRVSLVIRHFRHELGRDFLHVELFATRHQVQSLVQGIHPIAAGPTIEIRPLKLNGTHQGLNRALHRRSRLQQTSTLRTVDLLAGVFAKMGVLDNGLCKTTGKLLAQVPYRLGHLR